MFAFNWTNRKKMFWFEIIMDIVFRILIKLLAYLGAYGAHMFALWVWVGDGTSKTIEKGSFKIKKNLYIWSYHFENA